MNNFIIVHLKYICLTSSDLISKNSKYSLKTDWIITDYFSSESAGVFDQRSGNWKSHLDYAIVDDIQ